MTYNLLFNTKFETLDNWEFINCKYEDGYLISDSKVFGIKQKVILPDAARLYLRTRYNILQSQVFAAYLGIEINSKLYVNKQWTKNNKQKTISLVEDGSSELVVIHIIFESKEDINKVYIKEPILYNLNRWHQTFSLKFILDKIIKYRAGYNYKNLLEYNEIKPEIFNLDKAKIGSIISTTNKTQLKINAKLLRGQSYLIKLDYIPINNLGKIYLSYGVLKSSKFGNEQLYLVFKATDDLDLYLNIEPDDILPYQINLKHLLLIELKGLGITNEDIPYLPFI